MIKAVVIDDEPYACQALVTLLEKHCKQVQVVAVYQNPKDAIVAIRQNVPQLVFLDIEMPFMSGFELLEALAPVSFRVIFTTSYDQYAIRAIRFSALDYLLKPVDAEELKAAVAKAESNPSHQLPEQIKLLLSRFHQPVAIPKRIALPTLEGLHILSIDQIVYCTASSNYTLLTLKEGGELLVSRTLKEIEEMLDDQSFLRVHHSCLVNLSEIKKYKRGEGGSLTMSNGAVIDVARSRKEMLLKMLQGGS